MKNEVNKNHYFLHFFSAFMKWSVFEDFKLCHYCMEMYVGCCCSDPNVSMFFNGQTSKCKNTDLFHSTSTLKI